MLAIKHELSWKWWSVHVHSLDEASFKKFWKVHLILWWQEKHKECPLCYIFLTLALSSVPSSALTCLLCGKEDDEGDDDDEEQGDDGDEADLQRGPAGLLGRLGGVGLCHSRVTFFSCQLYELTWGERDDHTGRAETVSRLKGN